MSEPADRRKWSNVVGSPDATSTPRPGDRSLRLQILGPLRLWRGDVELDPGPRQQGVLLAVLLAKADQPVSRAELIDVIWDDQAPVSALNVIHKYVGALRRVLEPELRSRAAGSYLLRRGECYLFESHNSGLDLVDFRNRVNAARLAGSRQQHRAALDHLVEALALWRGSAGEGLGLGRGPAPLFVALNGEFFQACVAAGDLAVRMGQPHRVLPALRLAASMAPLNEEVHASLIDSLGAADHRAEALDTLRTVCARLADELGVDPGPALRSAQQRVLTESPTPVTTRHLTGGTLGASGVLAAALIGRAEELDVLANAVRSAVLGGTGVVVVDGEPGVGKTSLLKEMTAQAERWGGALVVWGMCLDGDGTPSMWPWVTMVRAILDSMPTEDRAVWIAGELGRLVETSQDADGSPIPPDGGARCRLFEQVVALVGRTAALRPVVLVIDDLHWADVASLRLLSHLSVRLPRGTVVVAALRDRALAPGAELSRFLATAGRAPDHRRIHLNPLGEDEVAELVRRETGKEPGFGAVRTIYARTAGNPFFVRELSRRLATGGAITAAAVSQAGAPSSVRDIVRSRLTDVSDEVRWLAQAAAFVGRDVGVSVLAHAAGFDVPTCLVRLEPLTALGVLEPVPGDPFSVRFPHDLVRESVTVVLPPRQATGLHLRIADAFDAGIAADDSISERLAYHLRAAGPLAEPSRTAAALVRAGHHAATKSAFEAAVRHLQSAIQSARAAGSEELELSAVGLLATVFWRQTGFSRAYSDLLGRAEHLARALGREGQAADFLFLRAVAAFSRPQPETNALARLVDEGAGSPGPTARAYARQLSGMYAFVQGDVRSALRYMQDDDWTVLEDARWRQENPLRRDLRMLAPLFRALTMTVDGNIEGARALLKTVEDAAGDDPYAISVWARWTADAAQWAGDPAWALRVAERWRAADPDHFFVDLDSYLRVSWCWSRAMTGDDPAGAAAEAEHVIVTTMLDPPLYGVTQYLALLAEMFLAAGMPVEADVALSRSERVSEAHGERFAECLRLLLQAQVLHARGAPSADVLAAAAKAEAVADERGARVIARRAAELMASSG